MKTPREKYQNDPDYKMFVDSMVAMIDQCQYTPSEMREMAVLASIIYEEINIKRMYVPHFPEHVLKKLEELDKWVNGISDTEEER